MPTISEYAQLANRVYFRTPANRTTVPAGWTELQWIRDRELTGFSAGVYQNGNDIVISYTGTNEGKVKDFAVANLPAAGPLPSAQVWEAMELYLEVKRNHPGTNITFTGHSLGGGLASMMAVFFDRPATTFDADVVQGSAGSDRILLEAGVLPSDLTLGRNAGNLYLALDGGATQMLVAEFFSDASDEVESIEFSDGTVWNTAYIAGHAPNLVLGTSGTDTFSADGGQNIMAGGTGYDTYNVDNVGDAVWEVDEAPPMDLYVPGRIDWAHADWIDTTVSYTLPVNVESLVATGSAPTTLTGNAGSNLLNGQNSTAANELRGGAGNDFYVVGSGDTVVEAAGEGYDDIGDYASNFGESNTFVMWDNVEKGFIKRFDGLPLLVTGNSTDNWLAVQTSFNFGLPTETSGGSDVIRGGAGNDQLYGLSRNTTYLYDLGDGRDTVYEYDLTINSGFGNWAGDRILFGPGIAQADVQIQRQGADLWIGVGGGGDGILLDQFGLGSQRGPLEYLQFADGSIVDLLPWAAAEYSAGDETIVGGAGDDLIYSLGGNDTVSGLGGNDLLNGGDGNDTLNGGTGNDQLVGGAGNDTYVVDSASDFTGERANEGIDMVQSNIAWTLGAEIENLTLTGSSPVNGAGNSLNNVLTGNSGANVLTGETGDDVYVIGSGDTVVEAAGDGTDTVQSSVTHTLASNVENLTLTGSSAINATGNALNNVLTGNSGTNTLTGGAGSDTYVVTTGDTTTEAASAGTDTVLSSVTWTLATNLENLTLTGTGNINATGNTVANVITGNTGNNAINGGTGADTMIGGAGNDSYTVDIAGDAITELAGEGTDSVSSSVTYTLSANVENLTLTGSSTLSATGNALDNVLSGNAGNDTLDGLAGTDTMRGGLGDDIYIVERTADVVTENAGEGTDTIRTSVTLTTLAANVENLTLLGSGALNATGNGLNNILIGNGGANVLQGAAGDDTYDGGAGNDTITDNSTTSNDTFRWGNGAGLDVLTDSGGTLDHVDLFAGITASQLQFAHVGNNLELSILGNALDKLTINGWYTSTANQIEEFRLADGSKVLAAQVNSLVSAMAAFGGSASTGPIGTTMTIQPVRPGVELTSPWVA